VHLVGFTMEIFYDARSYKRQTDYDVSPPFFQFTWKHGTR